jgi:hypothetical protein
VLRYGKRERLICESSIILNSNGLSAFTYTSGLTKISARCVL